MNLEQARKATEHITDPKVRADKILELVDQPHSPLTSPTAGFPLNALVMLRKHTQRPLIGRVVGPGERAGEVSVLWDAGGTPQPCNVITLIRVDQVLPHRDQGLSALIVRPGERVTIARPDGQGNVVHDTFEIFDIDATNDQLGVETYRVGLRKAL